MFSIDCVDGQLKDFPKDNNFFVNCRPNQNSHNVIVAKRVKENKSKYRQPHPNNERDNYIYNFAHKMNGLLNEHNQQFYKTFLKPAKS